MKDVVVIGAGKIGATVARLLASTGDYQVTLADRSPEALGRLDREERIRVAAADVEDISKLVDLLNGQFAVLNAAPFHLTTIIAASDCSCQLLPSTTLLARLQQGRCYRGPIYVGFDFPIGLPKAYPERTALRWPKIPLVSASLKCEVRTAVTSMPKSFAAATCPWPSLQGNDRDDSHLVGVLR
jgi:hypothetical protein